MARVTRSANNLVPRKTYASDVEHGLTDPSDRSSNAPSEIEQDSDIPSVYHEKKGKGTPKPRGKPQAIKKRKATTKLGGEKKRSAPKKRNTGAFRAIGRNPSPELNLRNVFSGDFEGEPEEFEIPEPPPDSRRSGSFLEGSVFNEFQAWSARIRNTREDDEADEAPSDDPEGYDEGFKAAQGRLDQLRRADSQDAETLQAHNGSMGARSQNRAPAGVWMFPNLPPQQTAKQAGDIPVQHTNEKSEAGEGMRDADWEIQEQANTELVTQLKLQEQREEEGRPSEPPPDESSSDNVSVDLVKFNDDGNGPIKEVYDLHDGDSQVGDHVSDADQESDPRNMNNHQGVDNSTPLQDEILAPGPGLVSCEARNTINLDQRSPESGTEHEHQDQTLDEVQNGRNDQHPVSQAAAGKIHRTNDKNSPAGEPQVGSHHHYGLDKRTEDIDQVRDIDLNNHNASTKTPPRPKPLPSPMLKPASATATPAIENQTSQPLVYTVPGEGSTMTEVKSSHLRFILKSMEGRGWTDRGTEWEARLLSGFNVRLSRSDRDEINAERSRWKLPPLDSVVGPHIMWYNAKRKRNSVDDERSRMLLYYMYKMWHTFRRAPPACVLRNQAEYFTNGDGKALPKLIQLLQSRIDSACNKLTADKDDMRKLATARQMRISLSRTLIPFLALILKEAFLLANISPQKRATLGDVARLPISNRLTDWHLQLTLAILGWMKQLTRVMISDYRRSPPRKPPVDWEEQKQQRRTALDHMENFEGFLQRALEAKSHRTHKASQRAKEAENARRMRDANEVREAREKEDRERQDRQYQRFMKSMVTPSQSRDRAESPAAPRFNLWKRAKKMPREDENRLPPKEVYALDNNGWYWEEDCRILNAIRRVAAPNAANLAEDLPGRTAEEVSKRIPEVRDIARKHFVRQGRRVPDWCWRGDV